MNTTIRGYDLRVAALIALLAVLFVVAVALAMQGATTDIGDPAMCATSAGGSSLTEDPYIDRHAEMVDRHAEVVARYHGIHPDVSSITKDSYVHSRAEVIARHNGGGIR